MLKYFFTCLLVIVGIQKVLAQNVLDSIEYEVALSTAISSSDYQPHYSLANQNDLVDPFQQGQLILQAKAFKPFFPGKKFDYAAGIEMAGNSNIAYSRAQQAFLFLKYDALQLRVGRWQETIGIQYDSLSTGSLALSANARPLPKVFLGIPYYTAVPFTQGYFEIKGGISHGWFEADRFISNVLLHEKYLYARLGGDLPVKAYSGLVHFAQWGGKHPSRGELPDAFSDLTKVFFARNASRSTNLGGEIINALGNHLGVWDLGLEINFNKFDLFIYNQYPYEDQSNLHTIFLTNLDRLAGVHIKPKGESKIVADILLEYMTSTYQSGPGLPDPTNRYPDEASNYGYNFTGRDDFYNNYLYFDGWTYNDRILGTPLFFTRERAEEYLDEVTDTYGKIVNNRVEAYHVGVQGFLDDEVFYKILATHTVNYGTYAGNNKGRFNWASREDPDFNYVFRDGLSQTYLSFQSTFPLKFHPALSGSAAINIDFGSLSDQIGLQAGIIWNN